MNYLKLLIVLTTIGISPEFIVSRAQSTEDTDIDDDQPDVFPEEDSVDMDTEPDEDVIIMEEDEDSQ